MKEAQILLLFIILLFVIVLCVQVQIVQQREQIIDLQVDNSTQGNRIRVLENDILFVTQGFFDEYDLTYEDVQNIISAKKKEKKNDNR